MRRRYAGPHVTAVLFSVMAGTVHAETTWVSVRDRTGAPVTGATVEILAGEEVVARAGDGEEGEHRATLPPGDYRARATAPGFVAGLSGRFTQTAETFGGIEIALFPGSALAATILDTDHQAISRVEVCLELHDWSSYPPSAFGDGLLDEGRQCFEADERGQMITPILPLGEFDLTIAASGFVSNKRTLSLRRNFEAQIWRLERGGGIRGRVVDQEGRTVAHAAVRATHRELEATARAKSNTEGVFELGGLVSGPWTVRVEPRDAAVLVRDGIVVEAGAIRDLGVLRARPGLSLSGTVFDVRGDAIADAEIQLRRSDRFGRLLRTVKSDADGRFVAAGLGEAALDLFVDAPDGHAGTLLEDVEPPRQDLDIELSETATVCGRVLTEEGNVAAGTSLRAVPGELESLKRYEEKLVATTRGVDPASGRFCLENVHPGPVAITARAAGYRPAEAEIDAPPGRESEPVELTLKRGLSLTGTVIGRNGEPLRDAAVHAHRSSMVYTDDFGEFVLRGLGAGMNRVFGAHPDYARAERQVMLPLGEGEEFVLELGVGGTIEGGVTRRGGSPVGGVPVSISSPDRRQLTDDRGEFRFENVPPGERTVTRNSRDGHDDFEHRSVEVVEDETVRVDFELGTVLQGNVLQGGVPVPDVVITLAQPQDVAEYTNRSHGVRRTYSDESGAYRLSGVRPGWGTVTLGFGRQTVVRQIEVPPGDEPWRDLLLPDRPISGTVVRATDDVGIEGASVQVDLAGTAGAPESRGSSSYSSSNINGGIRYNLTSSATCRTTTDAAGRFETLADSPSETEVSAWSAGFRRAGVTAQPGTPLKIELWREARLLVQLRDTDGNPVSRADVCAVRLSDDGNTSTNCSRGGSDRVRFSLNEGRYKIQASAAGFGTEVLEHEMTANDAGSEEVLTVTLVPGAPLNVRLVGQPTAEAKFVSLIAPDNVDRTDLVREESTDAATGDRRWTTWPLNRGRWTLSVDPGSGRPIVRQVDVVPGGPIEVVVP